MSKDIKDFPLAYKIIIAFNGQSDLINNIFNPKRYGEIDYAIGEIKRLCLVDRKDIKWEESFCERTKMPLCMIGID